MRVEVFDVFARTIAKLPAQCILKALDLECLMLKNDELLNRMPLPTDAFSILFFREFLHAMKCGQTLICGRPLPPDHIEFLKKTIVRLVHANELPSAAMDQFDCAFVSEVS
jgi:hypothetical protein